MTQPTEIGLRMWLCAGRGRSSLYPDIPGAETVHLQIGWVGADHAAETRQNSADASGIDRKRPVRSTTDKR